MPTAQTAQFQHVAKELYKKNLELVNANKEMALLQKLYEIMADKFTVEEVAEGFVQTISHDLGLRGGTVALRFPNTNYLQPIAWHFTHNNLPLLKLIGRKLHASHIPLSHKTNLLVKSFHDHEKNSTRHLDKIFYPTLSLAKIDNISQTGQINSAIVYPLTFGPHTLGVVALLLHRDIHGLSNYEKEVLKRVSIVFGVALDRVMIYQDLKAANKKLQLLDHLKDEFVSIASHELRTPMTAIKSYLWMVLHQTQPTDVISDKTKQYLDRAYSSTERLIDMVNDMLDISRIEGGRVEFKPESLDLTTLAQQVKEEVGAKATENQLQVIVNDSTKIPPVWADKNKIHQVLLNLVGNSLKFTPPGGKITISFKINTDKLETLITDTGKGISKEDLPKLFTKFGRLEQSFVSIATVKGTGLGLYICKQYIELQKGSIWVNSVVNQGSTFAFSLPLATSSQQKSQAPCIPPLTPTPLPPALPTSPNPSSPPAPPPAQISPPKPT